MKKADAVAKWGEHAVELARDYYETDFNKVLFAEDCVHEDDYAATEEDQVERCSRAYRNINHETLNETSGLKLFKVIRRDLCDYEIEVFANTKKEALQIAKTSPFVVDRYRAVDNWKYPHVAGIADPIILNSKFRHKENDDVDK